MTRTEQKWIRAEPDRCRVWHPAFGWQDTPGGSNCQACMLAAKEWGVPVHEILPDAGVSVIPKSEEESRMWWRHYFGAAPMPAMEDEKWKQRSSEKSG